MRQRNKGTKMTYKMKGGKGHRREGRVYNKVFYAMIPLSLVGVHQRFVGNYCFHLLGISEKYVHPRPTYFHPEQNIVDYYQRLGKTCYLNLQRPSETFLLES